MTTASSISAMPASKPAARACSVRWTSRRSSGPMTPASRPTTDRPRRAAPGAPHATGAFSMSSYRLRSHIRHCQFGPRTICLDLAASRYFLLEGAAAAHLTDFVEGAACGATIGHLRSEEHTSELQSLMRISYAVFCLKKKKTT